VWQDVEVVVRQEDVWHLRTKPHIIQNATKCSKIPQMKTGYRISNKIEVLPKLYGLQREGKTYLYRMYVIISASNGTILPHLTLKMR